MDGIIAVPILLIMGVFLAFFILSGLWFSTNKVSEKKKPKYRLKKHRFVAHKKDVFKKAA